MEWGKRKEGKEGLYYVRTMVGEICSTRCLTFSSPTEYNAKYYQQQVGWPSKPKGLNNMHAHFAYLFPNAKFTKYKYFRALSPTAAATAAAAAVNE